MSNTNYGTAINPDTRWDKAVLKSLKNGRLNVVGIFNPDNTVTQTTLIHPTIGPNSYVALYPISLASASVATKFAEDKSQRGNGTAVILHPSFASGSAFQFMFIIMG